MAFDIAKKHLDGLGLGDRVMVFDVSSATVELAAAAVGTEPARIAKSMSFLIDGKPVLIILAGDVKVSNPKFKAVFHTKAKMLGHDEVGVLIGHEVGGVCPFGIREGVTVWMDESLRRFDTVYPACGSSNSAVRLSVEELEKASGAAGWVDVSVSMVPQA